MAGRITRREFIGRAAALGVSAALTATMLAKAGAAQEPKKGGLFKLGIGHGSTTDSLDPGTWENTFMQSLGSLFGEPLVGIDQKSNVVPALAESFEPSDGAKKWVFKLRKDLAFHNGKSLTAEDVVATYDHHRGKDSKSAAKSILDQIADIKADGVDTVVFTLTSGNADFPYVTGDYHMPIFPAKDGAIDFEGRIGAGPFVLESFEPGIRAKAKRYPNYYGTAYFDEVEMLSIGDVAARTNALSTGDVHFIDRCDLKTLDFLKQNADVEIDEVTGFGHYVAPMNVTVAPFDNPDVRKAIKYAIDRESIVKKVLLGHGSAGNDNPIARSIKFAIQPEPIHTYDPDKAKFHLEKAGMPSLKVDFSAAEAAFTGALDSAVLMKDSAAKAGIDINIIREPDDGYWDNVWMKKAWCTSFWSGRPTVDLMMTPPMPRMPPGTKPSGSTRDSTNYWWRRVPRPMNPNGRRCMRRCSNSCMTTVELWC
jgi:peptide/nickel transport system substrate-binding protein